MGRVSRAAQSKRDNGVKGRAKQALQREAILAPPPLHAPPVGVTSGHQLDTIYYMLVVYVDAPNIGVLCEQQSRLAGVVLVGHAMATCAMALGHADVKTPPITRDRLQQVAQNRQLEGLDTLPETQLRAVARGLFKSQAAADAAVLAEARAIRARHYKRVRQKRKLARMSRLKDSVSDGEDPSVNKRSRLTIDHAVSGIRKAVAGFKGTTSKPPDYFVELSPTAQRAMAAGAMEFFLTGAGGYDYTFIQALVGCLPRPVQEAFYREVSHQ